MRIFVSFFISLFVFLTSLAATAEIRNLEYLRCNISNFYGIGAIQYDQMIGLAVIEGNSLRLGAFQFTAKPLSIEYAGSTSMGDYASLSLMDIESKNIYRILFYQALEPNTLQETVSGSFGYTQASTVFGGPALFIPISTAICDIKISAYK